LYAFAINVPVGLREIEKGENISASISFLFAVLPLIKTAAGLGKISNEMAKNLSEKLAKQKIREYIDKTYPGILADEERIDKFYRGAISAAESIKGDFDLYYGTNKELRGIRAQIEDLFSNESIINIYEKYYKNLPNGKQIILKELYDLIQQIVNVKDTGDDYKQSNLFNYLNNETFGSWDTFLKQFELMVIRNINQQYVRQIAKYLSEFYIEMKETLIEYILEEFKDKNYKKALEFNTKLKSLYAEDISVILMDGALKKHTKDLPGAMIVWNENQNSLERLTNLDYFTEKEKEFLKTAVIQTIEGLKSVKQPERARNIGLKANTWFGNEEDFKAVFETVK
jgi:hypothetical protein